MKARCPSPPWPTPRPPRWLSGGGYYALPQEEKKAGPEERQQAEPEKHYGQHGEEQHGEEQHGEEQHGEEQHGEGE
ncbi:hypothetical protein GCM10020295_22770 [Streptomyces cinereospinus]